jgi:lipopolysaccharide biosynthesis protein
MQLEPHADGLLLLCRKVVQRLELLRLLADERAVRAHSRAKQQLLQTTVPTAETAVVIHAHYPDLISDLGDALDRLKAPYDLFVTIPAARSTAVASVRRRWPHAHVIVLPNRGRDILPFISTAQVLRMLDYQYVLKLHTKRSPHRRDGRSWFYSLLDGLIPRDTERQESVLRALSNEDCGIIGPPNQFMALTVNIAANRAHLQDALSTIYSPEIARQVVTAQPGRWGFFAGSMFWASLTALDPVLSHCGNPTKFEIERGTADGTFAHAVERLISIVPEIAGRSLYEIGSWGVQSVMPYSGLRPEWADVGPAPE